MPLIQGLPTICSALVRSSDFICVLDSHSQKQPTSSLTHANPRPHHLEPPRPRTPWPLSNQKCPLRIDTSKLEGNTPTPLVTLGTKLETSFTEHILHTSYCTSLFLRQNSIINNNNLSHSKAEP